MSNDCLNHLMILHVQKEKTDNSNMVDAANAFVGKNEKGNRKGLLGTFSHLDLPKPATKCFNVSTQTTDSVPSPTSDKNIFISFQCIQTAEMLIRWS